LVGVQLMPGVDVAYRPFCDRTTEYIRVIPIKLCFDDAAGNAQQHALTLFQHQNYLQTLFVDHNVKGYVKTQGLKHTTLLVGRILREDL